MKRGFGINSVIFLAFGLLTLIAWIGFEVYHQRNDLEIPAKLTQEANSPLPSTYDLETLKTFYKSKDNFHEYSENNQ